VRRAPRPPARHRRAARANPRGPKRIFQQTGVSYHGLSLSNDGRIMYVADLDTSTGAVTPAPCDART